MQDKEPPKTGPEAIEYALSQLDPQQLEHDARETLRTGKKSKRADAVKMLRITEGLKRNNQTPSDFMIHAVPVIPTQYRPFAAQGDTLIPGDENVLYKDTLDIINAYKDEAKMFGAKNAGQARLAMYDSVKSLYGYGDPVKAKTRSKGIEGYLRKVVGRTAKFSYAARRLFSRTQDNVGRSTITVDPDLGMDEIGLPKDLAYPMYAPYIQRRLKGKGFTDAEALRHTRERTQDAERALIEEMRERPVLYSRAPAWWRGSLHGATPKLIDASGIAMPPAPMAALAGDFDGNCVIGASKCVIRIDNFKLCATCESKSAPTILATNFFDKHIKVCLDTTLGKWYYDVVMTNNAITLKMTDSDTIVEIEIKDIPFIASTERRDKNGAYVYDVPVGVEVLTATPEGGVRWEPVTTFTKEEGCVLKRVTTTRGTEVTCSANESLATFDPNGGLRRIKPEDAILYKEHEDGSKTVAFAHAVPIVKKFPVHNPETSNGFELGWLVGAFVSDGTFDGNLLTFTKADDYTRSKFLQCLGAVTGDEHIGDFASTYREMHDAATNCGIGGQSTKIHVNAKLLPESMRDLFAACYDQDEKARLIANKERSCRAKKLPSQFTTWGPDVLFGIISGMLDGDGSLSLNRSKKKPQVICNFSTSSPALRDDILLLGKMLGVHLSYSVVRPSLGRVQRVDNYVISFSTEWLWDNLDKIRLIHNTEALQHLKDNKPNCASNNVVPISYYALSRLELAYPEVKTLGSKCGWTTDKSKAKQHEYDLFSRTKAQGYAKLIQEHIPEYASDPALLTVVNAAFDEDVIWARYKEVEDAPTEMVYDIGVPGAKVFALASGMIVYDTINVHVPSTEAAVKEVKEKLMPSQNPFVDRQPGMIYHTPKQEEIIGLYTAATAPATAPVRFSSREEALTAIRQGKVKLSDDIEYPGMDQDIGFVRN